MTPSNRDGTGHRLVYHYIIYPTLMIVTLVLATIISVRVLREAVYEAHRHDLGVVVQVVRNGLSEMALTDAAHADRALRTLAGETGVRLTLIDPEGTVLGDTQANAATMENHATRPEIRHAMMGVDGISIRFSDTIGRDLMYVALPIGEPDASGRFAVIRGALVVEGVEERLASLYRRLLIPGGLLLVVALLAATSLSRSMRLSVRELHAAAVAYAQGDLSRPIDASGPKELVQLAHTFESTARQLQRRIQQIDDQRRETEEVLNTIREPLLLLDEWTRVQRANEAALRFFGTTSDEAQGRLLLDLFRNSAVDEFIRRVHTSDGVQETEITTFDDRQRRLRVWAVHLTSSTSLLKGNTLMLISDVTPEYRMDQVRKDFVANVSHELKTPLTMILGAVETLSEIPPDEPGERHRFEEMIANHAARMTTIVEDLLDLARIEQEERIADKANVRIDETLRRCVDTIRRRHGVTSDQVTLSVPYELRWPVHEALFEMAVGNLLENAITYSPNGARVDVTVGTDGENLEVNVSDNGVGIPPQDLERVFERFYRVDPGRSRAKGGTGLGLSIVRHIARVHGGIVSVESSVGSGSTFTIRIPGEQR
ncbi:MAG: ATP-binding protein [Alkalispirochaeta sp.]